MRMILHRVFGTKPLDGAKCLRLEARMMYAFVINNMKRLRDDSAEAMSSEFKFTTGGNKVVEKGFHIPHEYLCAYSMTARNQRKAGRIRMRAIRFPQ